MPHLAVAAIEALGIDAVQLSHAAGQVGLGRLDQQVKVVVHQAVGVAVPPEALDDRGESVQECFAVFVVAKHFLARIAARGHMIDSARKFDAQRAGHGDSLLAKYHITRCDPFECVSPRSTAVVRPLWNEILIRASNDFLIFIRHEKYVYDSRTDERQ